MYACNWIGWFRVKFCYLFHVPPYQRQLYFTQVVLYPVIACVNKAAVTSHEYWPFQISGNSIVCSKPNRVHVNIKVDKKDAQCWHFLRGNHRWPMVTPPKWSIWENRKPFKLMTLWLHGPMTFLLVVDVNECSVDNGGCDQACENIVGSYLCRCTDLGFVPDEEDFRRCVRK